MHSACGAASQVPMQLTGLPYKEAASTESRPPQSSHLSKHVPAGLR
jgi:hypothetical protein